MKRVAIRLTTVYLIFAACCLCCACGARTATGAETSRTQANAAALVEKYAAAAAATAPNEVECTVLTEAGGSVLTAQSLLKAASGEMTVTFYNTLSTDTADTPFTTERKVAVQNGVNTVVPSQLCFDAANLSELSEEGSTLTAAVIDPRAFLGAETKATDMCVRATLNGTTLSSVVLSYTLPGECRVTLTVLYL